MSNQLNIKALPNGPLVVTLKGAYSPMYLCRCGCSEKKPFCDDTHSKCGFEATEASLWAEGDESQEPAP